MRVGATQIDSGMLVGAAAFLESSWIFCAIGVAAACFGWRAWVRLPANRLRVDRIKLRKK